MRRTDFDVITVGGGLAGASLAKAMAERGHRVLVVERDLRFRDRVRGELMHPWGIAAAKQLGIYDALLASCGHSVPYMTNHFGSTSLERRHLPSTNPHGVGCLNYFHPEMQETLLQMAAAAGATVHRGESVVGVNPGDPPSVAVKTGGQVRQLSCRLVVGADGRTSKVRTWAGFEEDHDPDGLMMAGVLLAGIGAPEDTIQVYWRPSQGRGALVVPIGRQRYRVYFIYRKHSLAAPMSGRERIPDFMSSCIAVGVPKEWFTAAEVAGPLATFDGADVSVPHPYRAGVVLIADAAAASDPAWGCGQSLSLTDVRTLCGALSETDDWDAAAHDYAREHDRYYAAIHRVEGYMAKLMFEIGEQADARRSRAFPLHAADPSRLLDLVGLGPHTPSDDAAGRRFLGEE